MSYQQPGLPPEVEQFLRNLKSNFKFVFFGIGGVLLLIFLFTSFYTVEPDEEAVIIRLGKYVGTYSPGLHFKLPFGIDQKIKVRTKRVHQREFGFRTSTGRSGYQLANYDDESLMVTGDLNVAEVKWVVQFNIADPFKYLFKTSSPERNIRDVAESIMRRVVGDRQVTDVLTTGRVEIADSARLLMQEVLDRYDMGIRIGAVKLQDVNPPDSVRPSFNEVNEAKQEQEKVINQAEEKYNKVIPEARGKAEQLISEAQGYGGAIVNRAYGDASKFNSVLKEYKRAPEVTKKRIYLETMEKLYSRFKDITIVDSKIKGLLPIFQPAQGLTNEK